MKKHRRKRKKTLQPRYVLLIMTVICIALIGIGRTAGSSNGPASAVASYFVMPMQKGINKVGSAFHGVATFFRSKQALEKENNQLKKQISSLKLQLDESELDQHELEEYQKLYKTDKDFSEYDKVAADVVAKDSGNWFSTFLINRGSKSGIKTGMNVIADGGLVGIVTNVGPNYAKVRSIIDDSSNVSVMDAETSDLMVVNGSLETMRKDQEIEFSDLRNSNDLKVKKGDKVVTSNVSSRYLKGIPVGYITSMKEDSGGLSISGQIIPIVDFDHLEHVLVIKKTKNYDHSQDN